MRPPPWLVRVHAARGVTEPGGVSLVEARDGVFAWHRIPLPPGGEGRDTALSEGCLLVLTERALVLAATPPFAPGGPHLHDLSVYPDPPTCSSPEPGVVAFSGKSLVAVDHPEYKRINLHPAQGGSGYSRGDKVYFDEIELAPTGLVTARAWHREGTSPAPREQPAPLHVAGAGLPPPHSPPPRAPRAEGPRPNVEGLRALERELGFTASPLLRAVVERYDSEPDFRALLDSAAFQIQIRGASAATELWHLADPCLTDLAVDGDGDVYSFYDYPPARGAAPPIVQWQHEVGRPRWMGPDFESAFADFLAEKAVWQAEVAAAILEELGLPAAWARENTTPAPDWLAATFGAVDFAAAESAEEAGDLLRAERLLVGSISRVVDPSIAPPYVERLAAIYRRLGWNRQLRTLRGSEG